MTRLTCPHCNDPHDVAATTCPSCGMSLDARALSAETKAVLFAEIERVASELEWTERAVMRRRRVLNEAWVVVPLVIGFVFSSATSLAQVEGLPLEGLRKAVSEWSLFGAESAPVTISISILAAVIGWFISYHRATEVEVEEPLVDYHPAIAVEKNLERYFPLLPKRPTVVLELEGGEQIAYGAEPHCYAKIITGSSGLALIASNRLLHFMTLDDA